MTLRLSCHCGAIAFTLEAEPTDAIECNCSLCRRNAPLLAAASADKLKLETPAENMGTYTFNKHAIRHHFCRTCGCSPYSEGTGRDGAPMVMVNLRCAEDFDLSGLKIIQFDGASM